MKHPIIDKILTEWSYRVHDGMPNPKNPLHLVYLRESLEHLKIDNEVIDIMMSKLMEQKFYARSPKGKKISVFTNKDSYEDAVRGGYEPVDRKKAERELGKKDEEPPSKDKEPTEEPPKEKETTSKITNISKDGGFEKGDDIETSTEEKTQDELRNEDHQTTNSQLNLSVAEAKAQAEKKGEKGVGAGTAESRAGEAAVHYTLRELLNGRDIDDIKSELMSTANDKGKILNTKWVNAAVNTAQWINDVYGSDIEEVVWDTPSGRKLIGVEGHGTSSDMFIKTKNGKNIGISLKQTTSVFLLNGGYKKQHDLLVESLSETLSPTEIEDFEKSTSIDTYWSGNKDDENSSGFYGKLTNIRELSELDQNLKNIIKERINLYKNISDEEFNTIFDSTKYKKYIDKTEDIISKLPHVKGEEMKFIAKLVKDPEVKKSFPALYDDLRGEEIQLTQSILKSANSNPNVALGLKKLCMDGMHIEDILFGKSDKLDEFITLYGNNPAVELDKAVLLKIFNMQDEYEKYLSVDDDDELLEEYKQELLEKMYDKIEIDVKEGARSGEIKIKHEKGEFHLFGIKARTKPLGTSPGLEMFQTSFMGNVIKEGTTDVSDWKQSTKKRFVNARIKEIMEDVEDSNEEQKKALMEEINKLRAL
jgi:hypothetical protein